MPKSGHSRAPAGGANTHAGPLLEYRERGAEAPPSGLHRHIIPALAVIFILGIVIRLLVLWQSLWYDEMFTIVHFISRPWAELLGLRGADGIGAARYSPNNHVLFNILARLFVPESGDPTAWIRFPSLLAGAAVPVALAWPLRRTRPAECLLLAVITTMHPWLIAFSGYARGYALLLLLCILATNTLPSSPPARSSWRTWVRWPYALLVAAAMYTQPVALLVVGGHAAAILALRPALFWGWFRSAAAAGLVTAILYAPFFNSARHYWSRPEEKPSVTYVQFLDHAVRHAQAGWQAPGLGYVLLPLLVILAGGFFAWRRDLLRHHLATFGSASIAGALVPLLVPLAGEARAMLWLVPLYCIGAAALLSTPLPWPRLGWLGKAATYILLLLFCLRIHFLGIVPAQPIRDAIIKARESYGTQKLAGLYMASREAEGVYGTVHGEKGLDLSLYSVAALDRLRRSGEPHSLLVFYEEFLERDEPQLWRYLHTHYRCVERLPGRISDAAIYLPRDDR